MMVQEHANMVLHDMRQRAPGTTDVATRMSPSNPRPTSFQAVGGSSSSATVPAAAASAATDVLMDGAIYEGDAGEEPMTSVEAYAENRNHGEPNLAEPAAGVFGCRAIGRCNSTSKLPDANLGCFGEWNWPDRSACQTDSRCLQEALQKGQEPW